MLLNRKVSVFCFPEGPRSQLNPCITLENIWQFVKEINNKKSQVDFEISLKVKHSSVRTGRHVPDLLQWVNLTNFEMNLTNSINDSSGLGLCGEVSSEKVDCPPPAPGSKCLPVSFFCSSLLKQTPGQKSKQ